jgi:alkylation response protein AidB-like acyl-CoA dehydrogenase
MSCAEALSARLMSAASRVANSCASAEEGGSRAEIWGCAIKAFADAATSAAVSELSLLAGAAGWVVGSPLEKAVRDLRALQYADGIHDSLYRSAGRAQVRAVQETAEQADKARSMIGTWPCS